MRPGWDQLQSTLRRTTPPGFEPGLKQSKCFVLPLHHGVKLVTLCRPRRWRLAKMNILLGLRKIRPIGMKGFEPSTSWSQTKRATTALHPVIGRVKRLKVRPCIPNRY